jgi:hypothetical protein
MNLTPAMNQEEALAILKRWESGRISLLKLEAEIRAREISDDPEATVKQLLPLIAGVIYPELRDPGVGMMYDYRLACVRRDDNMRALSETERAYS